MPPFYGLILSPEDAAKHRLQLFNVLHEIVFYGKGGYDFDTVYNMPVWLRTFVYNSIRKHYEDEAKASEAASKGRSLGKTPPKMPTAVRKPDVSVKSR